MRPLASRDTVTIDSGKRLYTLPAIGSTSFRDGTSDPAVNNVRFGNLFTIDNEEKFLIMLTFTVTLARYSGGPAGDERRRGKKREGASLYLVRIAAMTESRALNVYVMCIDGTDLHAKRF